MCSIDVIVPVYNAEQYLDRCLKSLIDQSYKNFNVFLINDGSTDSSELICKKYVNSYENINMVSTANRGVSEARNVGLSLASSKYIVFVDSDDYLDSHYLLNLFNSIKSRTQLAICGYSYVDVDGRILKNSELENFSNKQELIVDILVNSKGARSALWNKIFI
ncbi:MAG: glycosyltransferase family 2 protein, partial [Enterococcus gallinarum]